MKKHSSIQSTVRKKTVSARERAYDYLKEKVLSGGFKPGERLTEEQLAGELGVSRTPVREALHRLEQEGLIQPLETRGFYMGINSKEEVEELFEIRSILEGYALRCICETISEETLEELESFIQKAEEALKSDQEDQIFHFNTQFHDILHNLVSHKQRLHNMMADMRKYVLRYRKDTLHDQYGSKRAIDGHRKIMMALRLRDGELCERIMREHIHESKEDAIQTISESTTRNP
jgi:DNA-binding GntR family transcriptional regulator